MLSIKRLKNKKNIVLENNFNALNSKDTTWLNIANPSENELNEISKLTNIPIKYITNHLKKNSKPKIVDIGENSFVVLNSITTLDNKTKIRPLILIISKKHNNFITLQNSQFNSIKKLFNSDENSLVQIFAKGPTSLFYYLTEEIINEYFEKIDALGESIDNLEEEIFSNKNKNIMEKIHQTKKSLIYIHKSLISNREVFSSLENSFENHFSKEDLKKLHLLYSDINQIIDLSLIYRDILSSSVEVHLSNISNNLNIVMKKLTAWAAIILVPALIAGIYGMNFQYMPELSWEKGYFFALGLMLFSIIILVLYFKKKEYI